MSAVRARPIVRAASPRWMTALALLKDRPSTEALRAAGFQDMDEVGQVVADHFKLARLDLYTVDIPPELGELLPRQLAERHLLCPVFASSEELTVATCDPARIELFDWLAREQKRQILLVVAPAAEIEAAITRLYDRSLTPVRDVAGEKVSAAELSQATEIVDSIILRAAESRASDIHLEASESESYVRFRIDGMLRVIETRPASLHAALVSRLKILAQLDIAITHKPQDGRIKLRRGRGDLDLRVSTLPTYFGEKVCCRLLDNSRATLPLSGLGLEGPQQAQFERLIRSPYGLVLVTGPTGSGKSTTLYAAINHLRAPELNIVSVEDPVEYQLPGINQVQVNPRRGVTFASALRAILRQDPNVILVGEIRDQETGTITAEAAMTGHLVFSSLHTNDASSAITRLTELGVDSHLVATTLVGVVAQRLVRTVCEACAEHYEPLQSELEALTLTSLPARVTFRKGRGCQACGGTGYSGRSAVRELLEITDELKVAIANRTSAQELRTLAYAQGFRPMRYQALRKLLAGATTSAEVLRLTKT